MELEPRIKTEDTLVCTETGIIDSHGFLVSLKDANQEYAIETDNLINCAGLYADKIANMLLPKEQHYKLYFAKGIFSTIPSFND
ncbi:hypothetical protein HDV02_000398 [Globomyces sp. JEL0801]|nr:hypothetical protein HDV02_000398 [Globomyces sp. JEL0801]